MSIKSDLRILGREIGVFMSIYRKRINIIERRLDSIRKHAEDYKKNHGRPQTYYVDEIDALERTLELLRLRLWSIEDMHAHIVTMLDK